MINKNPMGGGVNSPINSKSYRTYKLLKTSIFILPIFCFTLEKNCYSQNKEELSELYNRVKYELENYRNPVYFNTFRLTPAYKACLSLSFDSDDNAEIEINKNKLYDCINSFVLHANEYIQRDFSEDVQEELNKIKTYGDSFKCSKDKSFYYWCENDKYKCYSIYDPTDKISSFNKGTCNPISKQEDDDSETPEYYTKRTYDKSIEDYTDTDATDFINMMSPYKGKFSCTKTGNLRWTCENDKYICKLYGLRSQPNHSPKYDCEPK